MGLPMRNTPRNKFTFSLRLVARLTFVPVQEFSEQRISTTLIERVHCALSLLPQEKFLEQCIVTRLIENGAALPFFLG